MAPRIDLKDLPTTATRPLYAYVGATDLAVERVRELVSDARKRATGVRSDVEQRVSKAQKTIDDLEVSDLREQATRRVNDRVESLGKAAEQRQVAAEKRFAALQDEARALPGRVQSLVTDNLEAAEKAYVDLAKRGEALVTRVRKQESTQETVSAARTTTAKAKTTATQAKKSATATGSTAKTAAKSTRTAAKKSAGTTKSTAKGGATKTAKTAKKSAAPSSAKATATAAKKTAGSAAKAAGDAASKVGD